MNNEAEIKQHFNDTPANTIWIECNITQKNVSSPLGDINVKKEPIEYENAEQKIPTEKITFIQNIDSKPELLEFEDNSKITYNLDTQNVGDDFQSSNHHQFKFEKGKMDITPSETEVYDKECEKNERVSYCLKCAFKFGSDDIPPNTICIECNVAEKDVFPLAEKDTKSECLEIEDSKISYNLDSQNVHHQFESEDGQKNCMPSEPEVHDEEGVNKEKIYNCSRCVVNFDSKLKYTVHLKTQHIVDSGNKLFKCGLCGCESKYKSSISRHMNVHTIDNKPETKPVKRRPQRRNKFKCKLCKYESDRRGHMKLHVKNVHREHKCPKCVYKSDCKSELKKHLTTHGLNQNAVSKGFGFTAQNLYKCELCEYESESRSTIYSHVRAKHDSVGANKYKCPQRQLTHDDIIPHECEVCNKSFRSKYYLKLHSRVHTGEKRFQCLHCDFKSNYTTAIKIHMESKHIKEETRDHKCTQCPYETNIRSALSKHVKRHLVRRERKFKCTQCSYETNLKSVLKKHVRNEHKEVEEYKNNQCKYETICKPNTKKLVRNRDTVKLYDCNFCNKQLQRKGHLKEHLRTVHRDQKLFCCEHCDFKTNYKMNILIHTNNKHLAVQKKKYKCAKCNYETDVHERYESHLKKHQMKIKKFRKCSQCAYRTDACASLNRHYLRVHNNFKFFECYDCSKRFHEKNQLRRHIQDLHITEKKYNCKECNYKTNIKHYFTGHILTKHSS